MEGNPSYRKNLADQLRDVPKEERPDVLREHKIDPEYAIAHGKHDFERTNFMESNKLGAIVEGASDIQLLKQGIGETPLFIQNGQKGMDHSEHLLKRIELAEALGSVEGIPETGGLRDKVSSLLEARQALAQPEKGLMKYPEYLRQRFARYNFSPQEAEAIAEKLSPETFASIDKGLEDTVVLLNALPDTDTSYSCAGHTDYGDPARGAHGYLAFRTPHQELVDRLRGLETQKDDLSVALEASERPEGIYDFFFNKKVPPSWIAEHGKKSSLELFAESKQRLSEILGPDILVHDAPDRTFMEDILRLQSEYLKSHPEAATMPYGHNSYVLKQIGDAMPDALEGKEYSDYYLASDNQKAMQDFLESLPEVVQGYRHDRSAPPPLAPENISPMPAPMTEQMPEPVAPIVTPPPMPPVP